MCALFTAFIAHLVASDHAELVMNLATLMQVLSTANLVFILEL